ncbi:MAG: ATP-binding cassette domain-containing protein [Chloroherpetonaceae bacterium]|nr:ATP-binding cassette domain-containing protein [Chloroherpetonaceae bacterium]MDW8465769.1 ATP-binding cassette domain-containing protein [Chloroherpetonaceae bacterium]
MRVIEAESLTKIYGRRRVVDSATFHVEKGQVFGFLGPNGSGKTTTIGMLLGIINISEGSVRLFETNDLNAARRRIGATLETPNFYPYLSGYDNLRIVAKIKDVTEKQIQAALALVELSSRQKDKFSTYSLGMKQRLAIAAASLANPELIILDEPTNGLDPEGIRDVRRIIQSLAESGKTVFLSSHLLSEVEQTCTHLAIIKQGKILTQGSLREIISKNPLAQLRAEDMLLLQAVVQGYEKFVSATKEGDTLLVELSDGNLADLNRYLFEKGVVLSHLALRHRSLEEAFLELTEA